MKKQYNRGAFLTPEDTRGRLEKGIDGNILTSIIHANEFNELDYLILHGYDIFHMDERELYEENSESTKERILANIQAYRERLKEEQYESSPLIERIIDRGGLITGLRYGILIKERGRN